MWNCLGIKEILWCLILVGAKHAIWKERNKQIVSNKSGLVGVIVKLPQMVYHFLIGCWEIVIGSYPNLSSIIGSGQ